MSSFLPPPAGAPGAACASASSWPPARRARRELEDEREAYAALSVRYERARIASELHDIVAHAISVMVVQAGAGQRLAPRRPESTAETFEAIAGAARQAEQDMGRLVALLGDEDAIGPAPDLALVEELVARAAGSGLDVDAARSRASARACPPRRSQAALPRRPGGPDQRAALRGRRARSRCSCGASRTALAGRGRQRRRRPADAALAGAGPATGCAACASASAHCGGGLEAGPTADGGWRVAARLPRRVVALAA